MTLDATLSPADVGALVERSADWIEKRVKGGKYEHLRVGRSIRFTPAQAEAFIRSFIVRPGDTTEPAGDGDPLRDQTPKSKNRSK